MKRSRIIVLCGVVGMAGLGIAMLETHSAVQQPAPAKQSENREMPVADQGRLPTKTGTPAVVKARYNDYDFKLMGRILASFLTGRDLGITNSKPAPKPD